MRGQAHVAFRDVQASRQAMRALQGFDFFGKEMVSPACFHWLFMEIEADERIEDTVCKGEIRHNSKAGWNISHARCAR